MESGGFDSSRDTAWAMSQENVDRFVKGIEAFNRGDISGLIRFMDPEIHFEHRLAALQGDFVGLDGVRGWFADLGEYFVNGQVQCQDVRDLGDRVLGLGTIRATGKESGVETRQTFAVVARYTDVLMTEYIDFGDTEQALAAAGLREWAMSEANIEAIRLSAATFDRGYLD